MDTPLASMPMHVEQNHTAKYICSVSVCAYLGKFTGRVFLLLNGDIEAGECLAWTVPTAQAIAVPL